VFLVADLLSGCITYTDPESRFVTVKAGDSQEFYVEWEQPWWANESDCSWGILGAKN
jgi:hypothetical protein